MGRPIRQLKDGRWVQGFDAGGDSADSTKWGDATQIDVGGNTGSGGAGADFGGVNLTSFMGGRGDTGLIDSGGGYIAPNSYPGGQDAYNKMLADLAAEEAAKKANTANNTATLNAYDSLAETFGGMDTASQTVSQAQISDYLMGMAQSQDAANAGSSGFDIVNGNTIPPGPHAHRTCGAGCSQFGGRRGTKSYSSYRRSASSTKG